MGNKGAHYESDRYRIDKVFRGRGSMQKRWKFFLKTIKDNTLEFPFVIEEIQTFLEPVFDAIVNEKEWQNIWETKVKGWR